MTDRPETPGEPLPGVTAVDRIRLERAAELARNGWGQVAPNPLVGCVLIRDDQVVGEGWHERYGGPHAEVVALRSAGDRARGATAYVSLEPCNHVGKTGPCSTALIEAGVARVVFGASDPGESSGGGALRLEREGIPAVGPVWTPDRSRLLNPAFFHDAERGTPWVALKLAQSLDGKIAARPGERTRLTGDDAGRWVHRLRAGFDAILVGRTTADVDDPLLTVRDAPAPRVPPIRVVADSNARMSTDSALFRRPGGPVTVLVADGAPASRVEALEQAGARVVSVRRTETGIDLVQGLAALRDLGVRSVLCEGGGRLGASLLATGLVQRLYLLTVGRMLGEAGVPVFGQGPEPGAWRDWRPVGPPRWLGADRLGVYRREF